MTVAGERLAELQHAEPQHIEPQHTEVTGRDDRIVLRFPSTPADTAASGHSVAAGSVMEWIDKAGYACAVGWAGTYCVTAYVGNVRHTRPISPGSLIEAQARIVHTGTSSIHILVTISSAEIGDRHYQPATTCVLVFVAKDEHGAPTPVPSWSPRGEIDRRLHEAAVARMPSRAAVKKLMLEEEYLGETAAPRTVMRFLVPPSVINWGGKAHGGTVMRWMDEAAYAVTASFVTGDDAQRAIGTYSGGIHFFAPVEIGNLIELDARVIHTTPRSVHVSTRVHTADPRTPHERTLATLCMSVFVVPGDDGVAREVAQWVPELPGDLELDSHARQIIQLRRSIEPIPAELALQG